MRLPVENLSIDDKMSEFDQWLTPKLERIKDTEKFKDEITSICNCINLLAPYLDDFQSPEKIDSLMLTDSVIEISGSLVNGDDFFNDESRVSNFYSDFFNLLFLVSGATDNNLKNHFLIKLKEDDVSNLFPKKGRGKKTIKFSLEEIPETTKSGYISNMLASCYVASLACYDDKVELSIPFSLHQYLRTYLNEYIKLILEDDEEYMQMWAVCRSYINMSSHGGDFDYGRYLLNASTIFKVRGSVSASGGHMPENILREKLTLIGLNEGVDFNRADVVVTEDGFEEQEKPINKTRAYDFVIPFKVDGWEPKPKLFIQSQFYAGDSGSVSHKVVDQTVSSRQLTLQKYPAARFVEYLDGAGYYASLRTDLKHMLSLPDTKSFIQVKSILIRLRREFQIIDFMTPVEFEHAIICLSEPSHINIIQYLLDDGYSEDEIERARRFCIDKGYISIDNDKYEICCERLQTARRLFILDTAVNMGALVSQKEKKTGKYVLVPGCGANFGIAGSLLCENVISNAKSISITAVDFESDLEWLLEEGVVRRV